MLFRSLTGRLIERGGAIYPVTLGTALIMLGFGIWATWIGTEPNTALIVMGMFCNGMGVGLIFPALMGTATQALPPDAFATGSGAINMLRQASIAIGVALFVAIVGSPVSLQARLEAYQFGWWFLAALTTLTLVPAFKFLNTKKS